MFAGEEVSIAIGGEFLFERFGGPAGELRVFDICGIDDDERGGAGGEVGVEFLHDFFGVDIWWLGFVLFAGGEGEGE